MRPYPRSNRAALPQDELVFNYRLSRARRIVENAFSILAQRFRIFNRRMQLSEHNGEVVIKSACALHNFLTEDMPIAAIMARLNPDQEPYLGRDGAMQPIDHLHGYHSAQDALHMRDIDLQEILQLQGRFYLVNSSPCLPEWYSNLDQKYIGIVQQILTQTVHTYVRLWTTS